MAWLFLALDANYAGWSLKRNPRNDSQKPISKAWLLIFPCLSLISFSVPRSRIPTNPTRCPERQSQMLVSSNNSADNALAKPNSLVFNHSTSNEFSNLSIMVLMWYWFPGNPHSSGTHRVLTELAPLSYSGFCAEMQMQWIHPQAQWKKAVRLIAWCTTSASTTNALNLLILFQIRLWHPTYAGWVEVCLFRLDAFKTA